MRINNTSKPRPTSPLKAPSAEAGLTLVEIMVVLIILAVLGSFLITKIAGGGDKAKAKITKMTIQSIGQEIEVFRLEHNALPRSLDEMVNGSERLGANFVPLLDEKQIQDAWGNNLEYNLEGEGRRYRITSLGADGKAGGTGVDFDLFGTGP